MLIKYYSLDGSLHIIEGVTDVRVPSNPTMGDYALEPWQVYNFDFDPVKDEASRPNFKVISYAKDGPCMLKCYGVAYICNDEGNTIERVGL